MNRIDKYSLMSHQTGATSRSEPYQTMESTSSTREASDAQSIKMHVPAFHACRCHERGRRPRKTPQKEKIGKRGYVGSRWGEINGNMGSVDDEL